MAAFVLKLQESFKSLSSQIFAIGFLSFSFCFSPSFAQLERETSFEDRKICESSNGIWHDFGDECGDLCEPKFEKNPICTKRIFFSCDCGAKRCFDGKKCVKVQEYWQENAAKKIAENQEIEEAKKKRAKQYAAIQRLRAGTPPAKMVKENTGLDSLSSGSQAKNDQQQKIEIVDMPVVLDQSNKQNINESSDNLSSKNSEKSNQKIEIRDLLQEEQNIQKNKNSKQSSQGSASNVSKPTAADDGFGNLFSTDQNYQSFSDSLIRNVETKIDNNSSDSLSSNQAFDQDLNLLNFDGQK